MQLAFGPVTPVRIGDGGRDGQRFTQALWYAWGAADFGAELPSDAMNFARDYATVGRMFDAERQVFMPSMQSAFRNWLNGYGIDFQI